MTLKPSLVFNWAMFFRGTKLIQTVNLNNKFSSFLVRILVRKDNTYNKVLKGNFIQRNLFIEKMKCCKFLVQLAGNSSESVWETKFFDLSLFSFFSRSFKVH